VREGNGPMRCVTKFEVCHNIRGVSQNGSNSAKLKSCFEAPGVKAFEVKFLLSLQVCSAGMLCVLLNI